MLHIETAFPKLKIDRYKQIMHEYIQQPRFDTDKTDHFIREVLGKQFVYQISHKKEDNESSLSLAYEAALKVIGKSNIDKNQIDILVVVSMHPEYFTPPTSIMLHKMLGLKDTVQCLDLNANCVGGVLAFAQVKTLLDSTPNLNTALIVCTDQLRSLHKPYDLVPDACFSDSATAILFDSLVGDLSYKTFLYDNQADFIVGPNKGYSALMKDFRLPNALISFKNVDCNIERVVEEIHSILLKNNISLNNVKHFYFSQFTKINITKLKKSLNLTDEQAPYVGDKVGYTGASSPFIAMKGDIDKKNLRPGDICVFWTIGAGTQHIVMLYQYFE